MQNHYQPPFSLAHYKCSQIFTQFTKMFCMQNHYQPPFSLAHYECSKNFMQNHYQPPLSLTNYKCSKNSHICSACKITINPHSHKHITEFHTIHKKKLHANSISTPTLTSTLQMFKTFTHNSQKGSACKITINPHSHEHIKEFHTIKKKLYAKSLSTTILTSTLQMFKKFTQMFCMQNHYQPPFSRAHYTCSQFFTNSACKIAINHHSH